MRTMLDNGFLSKPLSPKYQQHIKNTNYQDSKDIQQFNNILNDYQKEIKKPLQQISLLQQNDHPPQCLVHHSGYIVYCEIDRKLLCSSCMYEENTHRKHRVSPIAKSLTFATNDIKGFQNKLDSILKQFSYLASKLGLELVECEKYYREKIRKIKNYYGQMKKTIQLKENQQIQMLEKQLEKRSYEIAFCKRKISSIDTMVWNQLKLYKEKVLNQSQILTKYNKFSVLCRLAPYITIKFPQFTARFQEKIEVDFQKFMGVQKMVKSQLILNEIDYKKYKNLYNCVKFDPHKQRNRSKTPDNHKSSNKLRTKRQTATSPRNLKSPSNYSKYNSPRKNVTFDFS